MHQLQYDRGCSAGCLPLLHKPSQRLTPTPTRSPAERLMARCTRSTATWECAPVQLGGKVPSASTKPLFITATEGPSPTLLFSRPTTATSWGSWLWETSASLWLSSKASKNCRGSRPLALPWKKLQRQQSRAVPLQWNTNSWPAST
ncbi:unnamed protein product, partial [Ixodes pacificus]